MYTTGWQYVFKRWNQFCTAQCDWVSNKLASAVTCASCCAVHYTATHTVRRFSLRNASGAGAERAPCAKDASTGSDAAFCSQYARAGVDGAECLTSVKYCDSCSPTEVHTGWLFPSWASFEAKVLVFVHFVSWNFSFYFVFVFLITVILVRVLVFWKWRFLVLVLIFVMKINTGSISQQQNVTIVRRIN